MKLLISITAIAITGAITFINCDSPAKAFIVFMLTILVLRCAVDYFEKRRTK